MKKNSLMLVNDPDGKAGNAKIRLYCSSLIVVSVTIFVFHLCSLSVVAQTAVTGAVTGTVTDTNGAVWRVRE